MYEFKLFYFSYDYLWSTESYHLINDLNHSKMWTAGLILNDFFEDLRQNRLVYWFRKNFVNVVMPSFHNKFLFYMAGACNYHWLWHLIKTIKVSDLICSLVAIHNRHANIGNNQTIYMCTFQIRIFYFFKSLHTIVGSIY